MATAKFDIKTEATRPIYAGVGVTDLAVGLVREYVADVQKRLVDVQKDVQTRIDRLDLEPKALREQAATQLQTLLNEGVATVNGTYADLAERGETLVERIRRQQSTRATVSSARTASAKARTTQTQSAKAAKATTRATTKKASTTARKTSTAPKSSAKATSTSARKTASNAAQAAGDAATKVGD